MTARFRRGWGHYEAGDGALLTSHSSPWTLEVTMVCRGTSPINQRMKDLAVDQRLMSTGHANSKLCPALLGHHHWPGDNTPIYIYISTKKNLPTPLCIKMWILVKSDICFIMFYFKHGEPDMHETSMFTINCWFILG